MLIVRSGAAPLARWSERWAEELEAWVEWEVAGLLIVGSCCLWATAAVALGLALLWWRRRGGRVSGAGGREDDSD